MGPSCQTAGGTLVDEDLQQHSRMATTQRQPLYPFSLVASCEQNRENGQREEAGKTHV